LVAATPHLGDEGTVASIDQEKLGSGWNRVRHASIVIWTESVKARPGGEKGCVWMGWGARTCLFLRK
jgi:hypothetical protein